MSFACSHCKGVGVHDNNPAHICIACHRTGLLPLNPDRTSNVTLSKKSKDIYNKCMDTVGLTPFSVQNKDFKVVVAGSGIAGAAVTLALQQRGINVVCYERDTHFNQRAQGYGLTLQQGVAAVHGLGIDCTHNNIAFAITRHNAFAHDGDLVGSYGSLEAHELTPQALSKKARVKHNVIITRQDLRQRMIDKLHENTIQWSVSVIGYTEQPPHPDDANDIRGNNSDNLNELALNQAPQGLPATSSTHPQHQQPQSLLTVHLSSGQVVTDVALLIGCEGIRSAVRRQKLQVCKPLRYLKTFVILGIAPYLPPSALPPNTPFSLDLLDEAQREQLEQCEHYKQRICVNQASDTSTRIYSMPFDQQSIMWQMSFPLESQQDAFQLQARGPEGWLAEAKARCAKWTLGYISPLLNNSPASSVTGYPAYDRNIPSYQDTRNGFLTTPPPGPEELLDEECGVERGPSEAPSCAQSFQSTIHANQRVTLLGDAMHASSPFKAQGANQAVLDGLLCARAVAALLVDCETQYESGQVITLHPSLEQLNAALGQFEREMIVRTTPKVMDSRNHIELLHSAATLTRGDMPRAHVAKGAIATAE